MLIITADNRQHSYIGEGGNQEFNRPEWGWRSDNDIINATRNEISTNPGVGCERLILLLFSTMSTPYKDDRV